MNADPRLTMLGPTAPPPAPAAGTADPTFAEILDVLWNRRLAILLTSLIAAALAGLAVSAIEPTYTSTTQIVVDPRGLQVVGNEVTPAGRGAEQGSGVIESQMRILLSEGLLARVVEATRLDANPDFLPGNGLGDRLKRLVGIMPPELDAARRRAWAIAALKTRIAVQRAQSTFVFDISARTRDPELSMRLARAVAQAYVGLQADTRRDVTGRIEQALTTRLDEQREKVLAAEREIERFKLDNGLLSAEGRSNIEQQLVEITNQLGQARARTNEVRARVDQLAVRSSAGSLAAAESLPEAILSPTVAQLRGQFAAAKRIEDSLATRLQPRHPDLVVARAQTRTLASQIDAEIGRIVAAARRDLDRAMTAERGVEARYEELKRTVGTRQASLVKLRDLERELQARRGVYESFLTRTREVTEQQSIDSSFVSVLTPAGLPLKADGLPPALVMVGAGAVGLSLGGIGAVLADQFRPTVRSARQLAAASGLPVLAELPRRAPMETGLKIYDRLRQRPSTPGDRIIAVTTCGHRTSSARTAVAIARAAAQRGERTLLIDTDRRTLYPWRVRRALAKADIEDVLAGKVTVAEAAATEVKGLTYAVLGRRAFRQGAPVFTAAAIRDALSGAGAAFDTVVVNAGRYEGEPLAPLIAEGAGTIVLVAERRVGRQEDLASLRSALEPQAARIAGAVLVDRGRA